MKEEIHETLITKIKRLEDHLNKALIEINGTKYLPLWLQRYSNGPNSTLSADTLQGIKIGIRYIMDEIERLKTDDI